MSLPMSSIVSGGLALGGNGSIKPVSILDCADVVGTAGQVLSSTGTALEWISSSAPAAATPTVAGILYGCTDAAAPDNTALGFGALEYAFIGCCNTAIGLCAQQNGDGCGNTSVGAYSLLLSQAGPNTAIGCGAGCNLSSGCLNVLIGHNVQTSSPSSQCELVIGYTTGQHWLTGNCTLAIKPGAGIIDCANSCGTTGQVLSSVGNAVCWITPAGASAATPATRGTLYGCTTDAHPVSGSGDVALGLNAYAAVTTGYSNTAIGGDALAGLTSGCNNIGIGDQAGFAITTESDNVIIGANSVLNCAPSMTVVVGSGVDFVFGNTENVIVGHSAASNGGIGTAISCSVILGACALTSANHVGDNLIAIGHCIALPSSNGNTQLAIGNGSNYWLSGDSNYSIKPGAGITDCNNFCGVANMWLSTSGNNDVCWNYLPLGSPSGPGILHGFWADISDPYQQCGNLAYGPQAMEAWYNAVDVNSNRNTAFGFKALASGGASGNTMINNVAVGLCALAGGTTPWRNVAIGAFAAQTGNPSQSVIIGNEAASCSTNTNAVIIGAYAANRATGGNDSILIGSYVGCCITSGCQNILMGTATGCAVTTGSANIVIGYNSAFNLTTGDRNIVIGVNTAPSSATVCNEVTISNGCATNGTARFQGTAGAWSFSSDVRKKENITALPVGREFINDLQPRSFSWCATQEESAGFIAQEVNEIVEKHSADYLRLVNKDDPESWMLAQTNMIPVLVKALQELDQELTNLKKEFNDYRSTHP